ncbi:unnamed protein product [Orchesella dallaii]|uniref:Harmonin-binding protein USHBP1 PDZ-binding domain-containing protein n=1 Tax=Orchesella dallaii TaxID=48710 RepID=A0ABP1RMB0_9HEXA
MVKIMKREKNQRAHVPRQPSQDVESSYNNLNQASIYEARLTELHSVIAELKKQLDIRREQIIPEESTDFEEDYELDADDLISIDEHHHHIDEKAANMIANFVNAKGKGINQNRNHRNSTNNGTTILLATPSDEDELESSSGMMDSSPVLNTHDNNLPSDVDVDGDYFEDDQIITEGFELKGSVEKPPLDDDVIDTSLTSWIGSNVILPNAADSNNCNIQTIQNPLFVPNQSYSPIPLVARKNPNYTRNPSRPHQTFEKCVNFSSLSSPESPEDQERLAISINRKCPPHPPSNKDEKADGENGEDSDNRDIIHDDDNDRREKVGLERSSGRKLQEKRQEQSCGVIRQSPQRKVVRKHHRSSRRSRDIITQLSTPPFMPPTITSHSEANGDIQDREHRNNAHLKGNIHLPSTLYAMLSTCKPEKLRSELARGGHVISPGGHGVITSMRTTPSESPSPESKPPVQFASLCQEVAEIRQEHAAIKDNLYKKEGELDRTRFALENIAKERDFLKNKVCELEQILKQSPKRLQHFTPDLSSIPIDESAPVAKLAERVKLHRHALSKTNNSTSHQPHNHHTKSESQILGNIQASRNNLVAPIIDCTQSPEVHRKSSRHCRSHKHQVQHHHSKSNLPEPHCGLTGADLMLIGPVCSTRVVEHLVQPIKNESALREMQHSLSQNGVSPLNEEKLREFEIETERLSSKIEHLRSQNDVLTLNLEDAKGNADRLTVLMGKYESNNVALQLAVGYSDHTIEAYDILVALLESELGQLLANLRATGIGANTPYDGIASCSSAFSSPHPPSPSSNAIQIQPTPIISSTINSGNNNNSNDNSPTGEHSASVPSSTSPKCPPSSSSSPKDIINDNTSGHGATALIVQTTTTTTTTTTAAFTPDELDIRALIERANENRLTAENAARVLLSRFMVDSPGSENNNSTVILPGNHLHPRSHHNHHPHNKDVSHHGPPGQPAPPLPWEETSSCSQTLSSASSLGDTSNGSPSKPGSRQGGELMKNEESRIRDLIITLKTEREAMKQTVTEVESWSLESLYPSKPPSPCDILEARKLDLETAVLMQELMAMREERAELRAQLFLLEKEKASLEQRLQSHEAQEEAYRARINYLKSEILDYQNSVADTLTQQKLNQNQQQQLSPDGNANNPGASSPGTGNTVNPMEREVVLKKRIQELAGALEKVTHNSKMREKQNHEMISELKRANGILIETLEAVKKKYQSRIRKMEEQIMAIMERHSMQLKLHKDRIHYLEMENNERSQQQVD